MEVLITLTPLIIYTIEKQEAKTKEITNCPLFHSPQWNGKLIKSRRISIDAGTFSFLRETKEKTPAVL